MALAGFLLSHANTDGPKAMEAYLLDWVNLLLRWTHVIVAIAWIGSSFYFVFLDFSLKKPTDPALIAKGVDGELWAVHGGGFYHVQKLRGPSAIEQVGRWRRREAGEVGFQSLVDDTLEIGLREIDQAARC